MLLYNREKRTYFAYYPKTKKIKFIAYTTACFLKEAYGYVPIECQDLVHINKIRSAILKLDLADLSAVQALAKIEEAFPEYFV